MRRDELTNEGQNDRPTRQWPPRTLPNLDSRANHRLEWVIQGAESTLELAAPHLDQIVDTPTKHGQYKLLLFDFVSVIYCGFLEEAKTLIRDGTWSARDFSVYAGWFIVDAAEGAFRKLKKHIGPGEKGVESYLFAHSELVFAVINSIRARQLGAEFFAKRKDQEAVAHTIEANVSEASVSDRVAKKLRNPSGNPTMTIAEVMQVFSKSKATIYRWIEEGKLSRANIPGRIRTDSVIPLVESPPEQ